jgi:predicted nucleic acid-binding protein
MATTNNLKILVDTSSLVALKDKSDPNHNKSVKLSAKLQQLNADLYVSSDIIGETLTVISRKLGKNAALDFFEDYSKSNLKELFIDPKIHEKTRKFFLKVKFKNISFIDCSSVIAMKDSGIETIFALDSDFKKLGVSIFS